MGIVKYKNPKTGIIYCYESTPKWDPEKGQARPTRTYLGRWDEETQSIIPTNGRRGRPKNRMFRRKNPLRMAAPRNLPHAGQNFPDAGKSSKQSKRKMPGF